MTVLYITYSYQNYFEPSEAFRRLIFTSRNTESPFSSIITYRIGTEDLLSSPKVFESDDDALQYFKDVHCDSVLATANINANINYGDEYYLSYELHPCDENTMSGLLSKQDHHASLDDVISSLNGDTCHNYVDGRIALAGYANASHTHTASEITDFSTAADARITAQKGASSGLCPLDSGGKVASGYLPSTDSITEGSTNLYFTPSRVRSATLTGLSTSTNSTIVDTDTVLQALGKVQAQLNEIKDWKSALKVAKIEVFQATSDSNGDISITTSTAFTNPKISVTPRATAGAEGYHGHVTSVSGMTITARVFKNKTQGVLLGGTIDPDNAAASTVVHVIVTESA